jgi:hypothetical protein
MSAAPKGDLAHEAQESSEKPSRKSKQKNDVAHLTDEALAGYIEETLISMRIMADSRKHEFLGYLLEMAVQEANSIRKANMPRKALKSK